MQEHSIRQLAAATILQALKDFVNGSEANRQAIIKDLRSPWMNFLTGGQSVMTAEKLEKNPDEIVARVRQYGYNGMGTKGGEK